MQILSEKLSREGGVALLLLFVLVGPATALTPAEIAQQSAGSVVKLEAFTKRAGTPELLGEATGFIVDRNGYVLTVRHLFGKRPSSDIRDSKKIEVEGRSSVRLYHWRSSMCRRASISFSCGSPILEKNILG